MRNGRCRIWNGIKLECLGIWKMTGGWIGLEKHEKHGRTMKGPELALRQRILGTTNSEGLHPESIL
jgi:hypothetical protein